MSGQLQDCRSGGREFQILGDVTEELSSQQLCMQTKELVMTSEDLPTIMLPVVAVAAWTNYPACFAAGCGCVC